MVLAKCVPQDPTTPVMALPLALLALPTLTTLVVLILAVLALPIPTVLLALVYARDAPVGK